MIGIPCLLFDKVSAASTAELKPHGVTLLGRGFRQIGSRQSESTPVPATFPATVYWVYGFCYANLLKNMVGPWGLEPQTSTVSSEPLPFLFSSTYLCF
ncbi:hypothetical protein SBA2_450042 [Acidobacteriia bacterium SbA2]|nr:hypothetical protein SBA2_450042 [Acidobacteriia bacterium SbA2]